MNTRQCQQKLRNMYKVAVRSLTKTPDAVLVHRVPGAWDIHLNPHFPCVHLMAFMLLHIQPCFEFHYLSIFSVVGNAIDCGSHDLRRMYMMRRATPEITLPYPLEGPQFHYVRNEALQTHHSSSYISPHKLCSSPYSSYKPLWRDNQICEHAHGTGRWPASPHRGMD